MLSLSFRFILYITANTSNHLGIQSAVLLTPLPPEGSPKTSLCGCPHTNSVLFLYLSLSPSQLSRLFFVFFPSFVDTHTRAQTDRQTDTVIRYIRYSSQCKSPSSRLNMRFTLNSFYLLCSRLLSSVLCVFSFSLSLSLCFSFTVRKDLELRLQFRFFNNLHRKSTRIQ